MGSGQARGLPQALVVSTAAVVGLAAGVLLIGIASGRLIHGTLTGASRAAAPALSPHVIAAQSVIVTGIQMVTAKVGWAVGQRVDRNDEQVLRTADGGRHWTDVTPTQARNGRFIPGSLGANRAWILLNGEARHNTVYRSSDGGVTWQAGSAFVVPAEYGSYGPMGPQSLQFVDALHGWMTFEFGNNAGVGVYGTSDGGMTWQPRSLTAAHGGSSTPGSLPTGCIKTGISFSSVTNGFAAAHCSTGRPFLYASHDGGRTWSVQSLPAPAGYPADLLTDCACTTLPPEFSSVVDGVLTLRGPDLLYATHDGGGTWSSLALPTRNLGGLPKFLDARTGWVTALKIDPATRVRSFDRLYVTHDGGQAWQPIPPNHEIQEFTFVTAQIGWAVTFPPDGSAPQLLTTADAGATWEVLQPVVDQATQSEQA